MRWPRIVFGTVSLALLLADACQADLLQAAKAGDVAQVRQLLASGVSPNTRNENGWTALHVAALYGQVAVAEALIGHGAAVDAADNEACATPLADAAQAGHLAVVNLLLKRGANVNATCEFDLTPLHLAAREGHTEVVKALLSHRARVNARDGDGQTPLDLALQAGRTKVARLLRQHGAKRGKLGG